MAICSCIFSKLAANVYNSFLCVKTNFFSISSWVKNWRNCRNFLFWKGDIGARNPSHTQKSRRSNYIKNILLWKNINKKCNIKEPYFPFWTMDLDIGAWVFDTVKKRRGNRNELITYDKFIETGNKTQSGAEFLKSLQDIRPISVPPRYAYK